MDKPRRMPDIVMYTQGLCGYCTAARKILASKGVDFEVVDVTFKPDRRREMKDRSGRSTTPQIFIDDQPVGGYDDLVALDRDGRLDDLLGVSGDQPNGSAET